MWGAESHTRRLSNPVPTRSTDPHPNCSHSPMCDYLPDIAMYFTFKSQSARISAMMTNTPQHTRCQASPIVTAALCTRRIVASLPERTEPELIHKHGAVTRTRPTRHPVHTARIAHMRVPEGGICVHMNERACNHTETTRTCLTDCVQVTTVSKNFHQLNGNVYQLVHLQPICQHAERRSPPPHQPRCCTRNGRKSIRVPHGKRWHQPARLRLHRFPDEQGTVALSPHYLTLERLSSCNSLVLAR